MRTLLVALGILALTTPAFAKSTAHKRHKAVRHAKAKTRAHKARHADNGLMKPTWL